MTAPQTLSTLSTTTAHAPSGPQAVWLDARRLRWPGLSVAPGETVRLYHSEAGALSLTEDRIGGATQAWTLAPLSTPLPAALQRQSAYLGAGADLMVPSSDEAALQAVHRGQALIALEDAQGRVRRWAPLQSARALDDLYAAAEDESALGVTLQRHGAAFKLWAPTAREVSLCVYSGPTQPAQARLPMQRDDRTGLWSVQADGVRSGAYYRYLVDVFVPGTGWVRNPVTDPYAIGLSADSARSYVADLDEPRLQPPGWRQSRIPDRVRSATDMVIYELHVRDFSLQDRTVPAPMRGKYLAFTQPRSRGMQHLRALSAAGLTDVHFLPLFDLATVPEQGCVQPRIPSAAPDSDAQRRAVAAVADADCFNWGYDPFHFNAPEGSFASDAMNAPVRILELRRMVMALHAIGLRVGMDVVYNHTAASGQHARSVLDRIVPGYYQRLDAQGRVERSTCCDNTATEHRMMGKLLVDSVLLWARHYQMASFRFDLMGHQPREVMESLQRRLRQQLGREVQLIGEGWNFGEVADGARFVQASQLSLGGSGIGTFSDRGRDAVRGGSAGDDAPTSAARPGFVVPATAGDAARRAEQLQQADLVRLALAGTLRNFSFEQADGQQRRGEQMAYGGQPAGYATVPAEVVNYVENHDNQTLFDALVLKLPRHTPAQDRARVQALALGINALSQGVAYFHAGGELLRSKSMDRNSYDSGDWFNRLDWSGRDNGFGAGLPPAPAQNADDAVLGPLLADAALKPGAAQIDWTRRVFLDLLRIRASTSLLRLADPAQVQQRLRFYNTGPQQQAGVIVGRLDGAGDPAAGVERLLYVINVNEAAARVEIPQEAGHAWALHPVQRSAQAGDARVRREARVDAASGRFEVPARSIAVFVVPRPR